MQAKDKTFTFPNDIERLEIKGSKPTGGYITVNKEGKVEIAITNGKYCITKGFEDDDVIITDDNGDCKLEVTSIGDSVYYNPNEDKLCTEAEWTSNEDKNGKSGCMRWYIYGIEGNKQKLILDHNTTPLVTWISEEDYGCGVDGDYCAKNDKDPVTLLKQLEADTKEWKTKADIVEAFDLIKLIPYFQALEDINTWQEDEIMENYSDLYNAALQDMLNGPQSDYDTMDAYLDAALDYAENKYPEVMLPRGLYRDMLYEWMTNENPTTSGYWTKTANALHSSSAWDVH